MIFTIPVEQNIIYILKKKRMCVLKTSLLFKFKFNNGIHI